MQCAARHWLPHTSLDHCASRSNRDSDGLPLTAPREQGSTCPQPAKVSPGEMTGALMGGTDRGVCITDSEPGSSSRQTCSVSGPSPHRRSETWSGCQLGKKGDSKQGHSRGRAEELGDMEWPLTHRPSQLWPPGCPEWGRGWAPWSHVCPPVPLPAPPLHCGYCSI